MTDARARLVGMEPTDTGADCSTVPRGLCASVLPSGLGVPDPGAEGAEGDDSETESGGDDGGSEDDENSDGERSMWRVRCAPFVC